MYEDLSTLVHRPGNPLHNILKVLADVFVGRIFDWQYFVIEVFREERFHAAHCLDDVCDACVLEVVDGLSRLHTTDVELRYNLRHI